MNSNKYLTAVLASAAAATLLWTGCSSTGSAQKPDEGQATIAAHLANFDDLDFNVWTNQKWDEIKRSHSPDVLVYWPDGHVTKGIDKHIEDMKFQFTWAPDSRIKEHPVKVAQPDWTAVIGTMEGTFTRPMVLPTGQTIPPTGKAFKIQMSTFGHWAGEVMDSEYLFWDNLAFMKQLGLAP